MLAMSLSINYSLLLTSDFAIRRFPNVNIPKKHRTVNIARTTASVSPAPKNPAPTGLMRWCLTGERSKFAQPRSTELLHTLHHVGRSSNATGYIFMSSVTYHQLHG